MSVLVAALHLALLAVTAAVLVVDARDRADARVRLLGLGGALAAGLFVLVALDPASIPVAWLNPVREGGTDVQVRVARGEGVGLGTAWSYGWIPWLGSVRALEDVVRIDAALAAVTLVGFVVEGWRRVGPVALLIGVLWMKSAPAWTAVLGGGPAPAAWLCTLAALVGLEAAWRGRWLGVGAAVLAGACLGLVRVELIALPGTSLVALALHRSGAAAWVGAWVGSHRAVTGIAVGLLVGAAVITLPAVHGATRELGLASYAVHVLHPLSAGGLGLGWVGGLVGWGWVALALPVLLLPARTAATGLSFLVLARLYHASAHGSWIGWGDEAWPLELVRYGALLGPLLPWMAVQGWAFLIEDPGLPRGTRVAAILALALAGPRALDVSVLVHGREVAGPKLDGRALDNQQEVRLLALAARARPECGFVAPGEADRDGRRAWYAWRSGWARLSGAEARVVMARDVDGVEAAAARVPGAPACVLLLEGMACADGSCAAWTQGRAAVFTAPGGARHAHPEHPWHGAAEVRLLQAR